MSELYLVPKGTPKAIRHLIDWLHDNDYLYVADLDDLQAAERAMLPKGKR